MAKTKVMKFIYICEFSWSSIGHIRIPYNITFIAHYIFNRLSKFFDTDFFTCTYVYMTFSIIWTGSTSQQGGYPQICAILFIYCMAPI